MIVSIELRPPTLSPELLFVLKGLKPVQPFLKGATIFEQGQMAEGVYLIESGEVRVLLPTGHGQRELIEVAGPETLLGLSETMTGERHRITAMAGEPTMAFFIPREEFMRFLRGHSDYCVQVVRLLSEDLHVLYHKFRSITAHSGRPRNRVLNEQLS